MADPPPLPLLRWVAIQATLVWLAAVLCDLAGLLPVLARQAGPIALVAGAALALYVAWPRPESSPPAEGSAERDGGRWAAVALGAAVTLALGLHLWAALRAGVPLGYDYGFYKAAFEAYEGGVPEAPPPWMTSQFEPGLPALHAVLHGVAGLSATSHLTGFWALLACAMVPAVFVAARPLAGPRGAAVVALVAAVSFTQEQAYAYLYEKNILALVLLVVALFLLGRRAWVPAGLLLAGVAILQRPTALLAMLALPLVAATRLRAEWRGWLTAAGVGLALALPVWLAWPDTFFATGSGVARESVATLSSGAAGSGGTFFSGREYLAAAAAYLPLAVAGVALAWRRPALRLPAIVLAVAGLYVVLRLPLHLRFLVMADAVALVVAAPALARLVPAKWMPVAAVALVALAAAPTVADVLDPATPHAFVTPDQLRAIQGLEALPANATLIADNLRAPYVLSEARHRTFGPGLFDDPHDRGDWARFWAGLDEAGVAEFLAAYGAEDVYVVQADDAGPDWGSASLREPAFRLESTGGGINLWHWTGGPA